MDIFYLCMQMCVCVHLHLSTHACLHSFACVFAHKHILRAISRCICELSTPAWTSEEVEEEVVVVEAAKHDELFHDITHLALTVLTRRPAFLSSPAPPK